MAGALTPRRRALLAAGAALLLAGHAGLAAAADGADLFATHCAECHSLREGRDKVGPSLFGINGRTAAASAGFAYSEAMRRSAIQWNGLTLDAYLEAPAARVPGNRMGFGGLPDAAERKALIAYLAGIK
ncbi:c-type cytochrome [Aquabacterium sp.]|uniref:c-type cytochrome n=1 Tax=Aquabacterium sp. TaxID=1872578 RepID=UPI003784D622